MLEIDAAPEVTKESDARRVGCPARRLGAVTVSRDRAKGERGHTRRGH